MMNLDYEISKLKKEWSGMGMRLFVGVDSRGVSYARVAGRTWADVFTQLYDYNKINKNEFIAKCYLFDDTTEEETDLTENWTDKEWKKAISEYTTCDYFVFGTTYNKLNDL